MMPLEINQDKFNENPLLFLEEWITKLVLGNQNNRLLAYDNDPIFDEPLIGVADGDDIIFREFKKEIIIGDFHLTPREALRVYRIRQGKTVNEKRPRRISVISCIFPTNINSRLSSRRESFSGSARWNAVQVSGKVFTDDVVLRSLVSLLEDLGYQAVAPCCTYPEIEVQSSHGIVSDWSEKHIAYAAGLGTFSLNGGLITPLGKAVNLGSIITDLALPITPRPYNNHMAYCLFYQNGSCKRCIKRCPSGSISEQGYDANKCSDYNSGVPLDIVRNSDGEGYTGSHIGDFEQIHHKGFLCGLCETKVPCEGRIPPPINT